MPDNEEDDGSDDDIEDGSEDDTPGMWCNVVHQDHVHDGTWPGSCSTPCSEPAHRAQGHWVCWGCKNRFPNDAGGQS